MKLTTSAFYPMIILCALTGMQACKAKKAIVKPAPVFVDTVKPAPVTSPEKQPAQQPAPAPAPVAKPDYEFSNIQFEFNSGILKTSAYPLLDKAVIEIKKDPTVKFILKGYASAEGTDAHNMELSVDRANAVKAYLVNSGVNEANLKAQGYGEANPVADNTTEAGRVLNAVLKLGCNSIIL